MKSELAKKLKEVLDNMSQEQFDMEWNAISSLNMEGPTFEEDELLLSDKEKKQLIVFIDCSPEADTFFPEIDDTWELVKEEKHEKDERHKYSFSYLIYEKKSF